VRLLSLLTAMLLQAGVEPVVVLQAYLCHSLGPAV
jgi:hypothetical protein